MKLLVAATIIIIAFGSALTLYFLFNTTPTNAVTAMSGNQIALRSASFLDGIKTFDNHYYFSVYCSQNSTYNDCVLYDYYLNQTNAWALYSYTNLYSSTGDSSYLGKAQNEMKVISNDCSANLDSCLWILVQMINYERVTGDNQYSNLISVLGSRLLSTSENSSTMLLGIESRELALLYEMNGQKQYLDESLARLQMSKNLWSNTGSDQTQALLYVDNGLQFYGYSCWSELAEIELYKATHDNSYLQNAANFFNSANIDKHSRKIEFLVALEPCIDSLQQLSSSTGNQLYMNEALNASQYIVTYRWDPNIQTAKKFNGDSGFLSDVYVEQGWKLTNDASYMIYLLTQMKDSQFQILGWN